MSRHPNDTLNGKLVAHLRPDDLPNVNRFGFWRTLERRVIRERLIGEGHDPDSLTFFALVENEMVANHANDISNQDYQRQLEAKWAAAAKERFDNGDSERSLAFNKAELEYLRDLFEGANSPEAISIREKVRAILG